MPASTRLTNLNDLIDASCPTPAVETAGDKRHEVGLRRMKFSVREGGLVPFVAAVSTAGRGRLVLIKASTCVNRRGPGGRAPQPR